MERIRRGRVESDQTDNDAVPGEQPVGQEPQPLDDAQVPPLTAPEDTEGG